MRIKIFSLLLATLFLTVPAWSLVSCSSTESIYRTIDSPDGNYKIVVSASPLFFSTMPGQGGDAPGYVRLYDKQGRLLQEKEIDMVQNIDQVHWADKKVYIKLFAEWELPN